MPKSHFPRTMAFRYHLQLFVKARWMAIFLSVIGILVAKYGFGLCFGYPFLFITVALMMLYNFGFGYFLQRLDLHESHWCDTLECQQGWRTGRYVAWMQILFDLLALFSLLHFTGGLENPFVIFFMLHMVMATILLEPLGTVLVAFTITAFVFALGLTERLGLFEHYHQYKIYGEFEPLHSWLFVLGIPAIILVMNLCLTSLTYFMMRAINHRRDTIIDLSKELEEKNRRLVLLDNRRKQTMAVVSHDLKAPIDAVSSYLIMMQDGYLGEFTEKQMDIVVKSHNRLKRLREFVSDVLDWQTIERGELQQKMQATQLIDVLRDSFNEYVDTAKRKEIEMSFSSEGQFPQINADPRRLFQVFDNLISNAVKYTLKGGKVEVSASMDRGAILIQVRDTGIGMSAEEISHLFEDFYRSPKVKKQFEGTGLGLSVVDRIVRAHHGTVWAESEPQKGTTFHVKLPIGRLSQPPRD